MNPAYRLFIDVCLSKPIASESVWMRLVTVVQFVPRNGDTLRFTDPVTENTTDLELNGLVYDMAEGMFTCDIADERIIEHYSEHGTHAEQDAINFYKAYGFVRLNFPQREGHE